MNYKKNMSLALEKTETIISTLLFLMTRYSMERDPFVCKAILKQLDLLENHPDSTDPNILNTCKRLRNHWSGVSSINQKAGQTRRYASAIDTQIH